MTEHEFGSGTDDGYDDIRELLANAPAVEPRPGALERIIATVAAADGGESTVIDLAARRESRIQRFAPRVAAAAVVIAIVGAVVGGVGTDTRIPAIGDLVASHQAAAAGQMPDTAHEMPMDDAHEIAVDMPDSMKMAAAFMEQGDTVHLLYADEAGVTVSVFWQPGETDLSELDHDGQMGMMGDSPVWHSVLGEMHVSVVDGDGGVLTVVTDHEDDEMMVMLSESMPSHSPSVFDRLLDVADAVVDPWRFGAG